MATETLRLTLVLVLVSGLLVFAPYACAQHDYWEALGYFEVSSNLPRPYCAQKGESLIIEGWIRGLIYGTGPKDYHGNVSIWYGPSETGPWAPITWFSIETTPPSRDFHFEYEWNPPLLPVGTHYIKFVWTIDYLQRYDLPEAYRFYGVKEQIRSFYVHDYSICAKIESPAYVGTPVKIVGKLMKGNEPVGNGLIWFYKNPIPPNTTDLKTLFGGTLETITTTDSRVIFPSNGFRQLQAILLLAFLIGQEEN